MILLNKKEKLNLKSCPNCKINGYITVSVGGKYLIACSKCGRTFANALQAKRTVSEAKQLWNESVS